MMWAEQEYRIIQIARSLGYPSEKYFSARVDEEWEESRTRTEQGDWVPGQDRGRNGQMSGHVVWY